MTIITTNRTGASTMIRRYRDGTRVAAIITVGFVSFKALPKGQMETLPGGRKTDVVIDSYGTSVQLLDTLDPKFSLSDIDALIDVSHERDLTNKGLTIDDFHRRALAHANLRRYNRNDAISRAATFEKEANAKANEALSKAMGR